MMPRLHLRSPADLREFCQFRAGHCPVFVLVLDTILLWRTFVVFRFPAPPYLN